MSTLTATCEPAPDSTACAELTARALPAWVGELLGGDRAVMTQRDRLSINSPPSPATIEVVTHRDLSLISAVLPRAATIGNAGLRAATTTLYARIRAEAMNAGTPHAVRIWNFIPAINEPGEPRTQPDQGDEAPGLTRYMAFNLGRFDGLADWLGDSGAFAASLPTATGVGHAGDELAVHALVGRVRGRPVENPRQCPAYQYSPRFGPRPPCFSRGVAVRLNGSCKLLIGGTASVVGEDSVHPGSLHAQLHETFENLAAVIVAGSRREVGSSLSRIIEARAYCPDPAVSELVRYELSRKLPAARRTEVLRADLCRPELLVEVEAVAELDDSDMET